MKKFDLFGLRGRIFLILIALVLITLSGGSVMIWYTYRIQSIFGEIVNEDISALITARQLEIELINQKGLVSYYFMDGNTEWLVKLGNHRETFENYLQKARAGAKGEASKKILDELNSEYNLYLDSKDRVIGFYLSGNREAGLDLHEKDRWRFFKVLDLCEKYTSLHREKIQAEFKKSRVQTNRLRIIAVSAMSAAAVTGALLAFILLTQLLGPIRMLALEARRGQDRGKAGNDLTELKTSVRGLIEDVDHTHDELERSREKLFQSEKMALVGKLAAEVAHSIRNPMTSIKMRLFSLERSLKLSSTQREDFEVVADEMKQLDNVVRNFLEFSRPPKLKKQKINISDVIETSLQLLQNQIELQNIKLVRNRRKFLPKIEADPELLKEVVVNLIVNACDAMGNGGQLTITEDDAVAEMMGRVIMVRISDNGPGISGPIRERVWEPFFSTKDDGSGLGLSIAARIIEEHGGRITVQSVEDEGATFIITMPVSEESL